MNEHVAYPPDSDAKWEHALEPHGRIGGQAEIAAQCAEVCSVASSLLQASARVWLSPEFRRSIRHDGQLWPAMDERTALMTEALSDARSPNSLPAFRSDASGRISGIAVPLGSSGLPIGAIEVTRDAGPTFTTNDGRVLESLSQVAAVGLRGLSITAAAALESSRLYSLMHKRAEHLQSVAEVSSAVTSILDFDVLTEEIVRLIHDRLGYPTVHLFTVEHSCREVVYRAGVPVPAGDDQISRAITCKLDDPDGLISRVARTGQRVVTGNIRKEPRYRAHPLSPDNTLSELAVPLSFGDHIVGVLDIGSSRPNAFDAEDIFLFEVLADSVAVAIRNAGLYRSEQWRRQVTESLQDVAGLLSTDASVDEVLEAVLTELERALPAEVVAVWLLNDGVLCLSAAHGFPTELCVPGSGVEGGTWFYRALAATDPTIRQENDGVDPIAEILGFPSHHSAIAAPLHAGSRQIGLLTLLHPDPGRFGRASRSMTAAFASYAAVAIENARLYQNSQEQAWISTVILQVAEATQSLSDVDKVVDTVVRLVPLLVGVTQCAILLWEEDEEAFMTMSTYGMDNRKSGDFRGPVMAPERVPVLKELLREKSPLLVPDTPMNSGLSEFLSATRKCGEILLVPLLSQGSVLGAMLVGCNESDLPARQQARSGLQDTEWQAILLGIAYQVATAIESIRLREAQQEEAYISAALLQVAHAIAAYNELPDILRAIVRITPLLVGVDWTIIYLWDEETHKFKTAESYGFGADSEGEVRQARYAPGEFGFIELVRARGVLTSLADIVDPCCGQDNTLFPTEFTRQAHLQLESEPIIVGIPLAVKGQVLGVMLLQQTAGSRRSMRKRLDIVEGIAQQAALAVQNDLLLAETTRVERMERELQLARGIQRGLLPRQLPDTTGWDVAATYVAAREVGGDLYDFLHIDDENLGIIVADVADKGLPASLFMVSTRALTRAAAFEDDSPAGVLGRVNDLLVPDADGGMFVTAVYALVSFPKAEVTYANAGHNPPIVFHADTREVECLREHRGIALGVVAGARVPEATIQMNSGDYLILYTDGVTEAYSDRLDEFFGDQRLFRAISESDADTAEAMLAAIQYAISGFVEDTPPFDDLTIIVIRYCG